MKLSNDSLSDYGFGWMLLTNAVDGLIVFHTGDNPGYATRIVRYINKKKTIILLSNNAYDKLESMADHLKKVGDKY